MKRTAISAAFLFFFAAFASRAQDSAAPPPLRVVAPVVIDCIHHPEPDLTPIKFIDHDNGIEFSYPAALRWNKGNGFQDSTCGRLIADDESLDLAVRTAVKDPGSPMYGDASTTKSLGQRQWIIYRSEGEMDTCTYAYEEQVCFEARYPKTSQISTGLVQSTERMAASLVFHPEERMDVQIVALKIGDKFGPLTVSRILDRHSLNAKVGSDAECYGEVEFTGTLTWTGDFEDDGTMNSGPFWNFFPDFDDLQQWPVTIGKDMLGDLQFRNSGPIYRRLKRTNFPTTDDYDDFRESWRLVVKDVSVQFAPHGHGHITATLVSMTRNKASPGR